ncbi:HAMP domain-containing sensor histidine kinase [Pseudomonas sp. H9]|uniref:sensor histidine kinase n=1 Tax=Pseudomonas sp. H9 TaxID=483968 RepID=UPI001057D922|nr:ATP-binding protein [Pseudomonas sp. H9]TDF86227.1 HAMP domain-containing protein [Pseudomonas sp. H9]
MIRLGLQHDGISRRIALTIIAAMLISVALNILFVQVAGVWARPPLEKTGLLEQINVAARVLEAAPVSQRAQLAEAASSPMLHVQWSAQRDALGLPGPGEEINPQTVPMLSQLPANTPLRIETFQPDHWPAGDPNAHYKLVMQLADHSWLAFTPPYRSWGLSSGMRFTIIGLLALVAALLVAWIGTRQLAGPLQRFARAARRFGSDLRAPPIRVEGPHELRQAITAFNTMQAQIQHFVAERTQMLAAISHDLRAPLTRMRLRGEFIEDAEQQRKLFRDVDEMQSMINAALSFFRDETRLETTTPFDLAELLHTLVDDYRDQQIAVGFEGPANLVYLGRPLGLKRAVTNLIDNAVKYAQPPTIRLSSNAHSLFIEVRDHGPGIPEAALEEVFVPFFRLESSRNRNTGGVGLGLPSARTAIREQGGELTLRNAPGGGLLACIELPRVSK